MAGLESTYGTAATLDHSYEMVNESMERKIARIESKGLRAGRRVVGRWVPGEDSVAGDVAIEGAGVGMGLWLQHALGAVSISGTAPCYVHTYTIGDLPTSLTVQIGKPDNSGTVWPYNYLGCRVTSWEMSLKAGELLECKWSLAGQSENLTAPVLGTWEDPAGYLISFSGATLTAGGTEVDVLDWSLKGDNKLAADRFRVRGAATPKQPLENGFRVYSGSLTADFESLVQYEHYTGADELSLVLNFVGAPIPGGTTGQNFGLTITQHIRYDGETPKVAGPELLTQPITYTVVDDTDTDGEALTVVYTTTDATP
jgi:hypothetical protein